METPAPPSSPNQRHVLGLGFRVAHHDVRYVLCLAAGVAAAAMIGDLGEACGKKLASFTDFSCDLRSFSAMLWH